MTPINEPDKEHLTNYVLRHFGYLATPMERDVLLALRMDTKVVLSDSNLVKHKLGAERDAIIAAITNPEVVAMIQTGRDHCRRTIRDRILLEHADQIELNNCCNCGKLARTPLSKMCVHCGHTWYDRQDEVPRT